MYRVSSMLCVCMCNSAVFRAGLFPVLGLAMAVLPALASKARWWGCQHSLDWNGTPLMVLVLL